MTGKQTYRDRAMVPKLKIVFFFLTACLVDLRQPRSRSPRAGRPASAGEYLIYPDRVYGVANNYQLKLDVWQKQNAKEPLPLLFISTVAAGSLATGRARLCSFSLISRWVGML